MCASPLCSYYNSIPQCSVVFLQFSLVLSRWRASGTSIGVTWLFLFSFFFFNFSPYVTSSVRLLNHVAKILYMLCFGCINILSADGNLVSHCLSAVHVLSSLSMFCCHFLYIFFTLLSWLPFPCLSHHPHVAPPLISIPACVSPPAPLWSYLHPGVWLTDNHWGTEGTRGRKKEKEKEDK